MPLTIVVAVLLTQLKPPLLAAPDVKVVNLETNRGALFAEHLAQHLGTSGLAVVTGGQISTLVGQERQKQLLQCEETSASCQAELATALGSEALLSGTVARIGPVLQVNLSIVSARDGQTLARISGQRPSELGVLDLLSDEAPRVAAEVFAALRPGHTLIPPKSGVARWAWVPAAVGVVAAGTGAALFALAAGKDDQLRGIGLAAGRSYSLAEGRALATAGQTEQALGLALMVTAGGALAGSGAMLLLGRDTPAQLVVVPTRSGALAAFSVELP